MAEKTAYYFIVDWLDLERISKIYAARVWNSLTASLFNSFEKPIKSSWIGGTLKNIIAHRCKSSAILFDTATFNGLK
ncbi:MAG: hypothetical protein IPK10_16330 [Bacteroidetes bacterium]|nr:hypothetical protein [Bacteroidota bacterium]